MRSRVAFRAVVALAFVGGCIGPQPGHRDGYEGPTGPSRPAETQLRGFVLDNATSAPISGATVRIENVASTSGADGGYTLQHLTMAAGTIETIRAGYDTARTLIPLEGGDRQFNVRLRASTPTP